MEGRKRKLHDKNTEELRLQKEEKTKFKRRRNCRKRGKLKTDASKISN